MSVGVGVIRRRVKMPGAGGGPTDASVESHAACWVAKASRCWQVKC
jgi:hypothetical protein